MPYRWQCKFKVPACADGQLMGADFKDSRDPGDVDVHVSDTYIAKLKHVVGGPAGSL